jgi:hypothetical protein
VILLYTVACMVVGALLDRLILFVAQEKGKGDPKEADVRRMKR